MNSKLKWELTNPVKFIRVNGKFFDKIDMDYYGGDTIHLTIKESNPDHQPFSGLEKNSDPLKDPRLAVASQLQRATFELDLLKQYLALYLGIPAPNPSSQTKSQRQE